MKAKFRWAALTALLASTLGFAAVPVELAIDFAAETAAETWLLAMPRTFTMSAARVYWGLLARNSSTPISLAVRPNRRQTGSMAWA